MRRKNFSDGSRQRCLSMIHMAWYMSLMPFASEQRNRKLLTDSPNVQVRLCS
jgi:hypothetical protein